MADRVISAEALISAKDQTGDTFANIARKIQGIGKVNLTPQMEGMAKAIAKANEQLKALEKFQSSRGAFTDARAKFNSTKEAVVAASRAMQEGAGPAKQLAASYASAQSAVSRASAAFEKQKAAVVAAKQALEGFGLPVGKIASEQARLKAVIDSTTKSLAHQAAAERKAAEASRHVRSFGSGLVHSVGHVSGASAMIGGYGLVRAAESVGETYRHFDQYARQTKAFGNFSDAEMDQIIEMSIHKSAGTKFNDIEWLKGAKALGGRGVKASSVMGILPQASNYGMAMSTDMPEAVAALEGSLFAFQRDLSTADKATAAARRASDLMVGSAKAFGLTHHDLKGAYEYGALAAQTSGLSEEKLLAFAGLGKKLNIPGESQGNAFRALVGKLLAPTQKGREALSAVGVDYSSYQQMPKKLSVDNFAHMIAQQYGVKIDADARAKLEKVFSDPKVFGDSSQYSVGVRNALAGQIGVEKAKDMNKVAGSAERFRRNNVERVDANGLFDAIMRQVQGGNLALANAIFGEKQGTRIMAAMRDEKLWNTSVEKVEHTPEGKAEGVANLIMGGFEGAASRFENAVKNLETAIGRAVDNGGKGGPLTKITSGLAAGTQALAELSPAQQQFGLGIGAVGAAYAGLRSVQTMMGGFGLTHAAGSLEGAAMSLKGAAGFMGGRPGGMVAPGEGGGGFKGVGAGRMLPLLFNTGWAAFNMPGSEKGVVDQANANRNWFEDTVDAYTPNWAKRFFSRPSASVPAALPFDSVGPRSILPLMAGLGGGGPIDVTGKVQADVHTDVTARFQITAPPGFGVTQTFQSIVSQTAPPSIGPSMPSAQGSKSDHP